LELISILSLAAQYATQHAAEFAHALEQHLVLTAVATGASILFGIPLGVWAAHKGWLSTGISHGVNALRVVPSLAVLFLLIPVLGLNTASAAVALIVLALPPVTLTTDAAFRSLDPTILEAARGMGMTPLQQLLKIELPLALPVVLTGVRTAVVEVIASATLAAFVGSGGLGIYITRGFALYDFSILLVGALPVALLALLSDRSLFALQRQLRKPRNLRPVSSLAVEVK